MEVDTTATKRDETLGLPISQELRNYVSLKTPSRKLGFVIALVVLLIAGAVVGFMFRKDTCTNC